MGRRVSVAELIGRQDELAALDAALSDTTGGTGRLVLVESDAGVGKSRLIQAFTSRAAAGGATVLAGGCLQLEADIQYAPFTEALRAMPNPPLVGAGGGDRSVEFRRVAETIAAASYRAWASANWHLARAAIDRAVALVFEQHQDGERARAQHPAQTRPQEPDPGRRAGPAEGRG